jgi:hypothetical protein
MDLEKQISGISINNAHVSFFIVFSLFKLKTARVALQYKMRGVAVIYNLI